MPPELDQAARLAYIELERLHGRSVFNVQRMADVVRRGALLPPIPEICGPLVHEGDLAFCFGPPNVGKTPFVLALAEQFCGGAEAIPSLPCGAANGPVLFCDFELSERQQGHRYRIGNGSSAYQFHRALYRAEQRAEPGAGDAFTSAMVEQIANAASEFAVRLVVVDNITALRAQAERAFDASRLVSEIKARIVQGIGATVIVVAHTPKLNPATPLTMDAMAGSAAFRNLADSVFSIAGSTQGAFIRRVQQHKSRNSPEGRLRFGSENNLILESRKRLDGLIVFDYVGESPEADHLPKPENKESPNASRDRTIVELNSQGLSQRRIADQLGISVGTVNSTVQRSKHLNT